MVRKAVIRPKNEHFLFFPTTLFYGIYIYSKFFSQTEVVRFFFSKSRNEIALTEFQLK
jgi:hypothetical protein